MTISTNTWRSTAVVTGATSGIGLAVAKRLVSDGFGVRGTSRTADGDAEFRSAGATPSAQAGLDQFVRTASVEFARNGVRVNAVAPGFLMTPLCRPLWADPAKRRWILDRVPLRRPGHPAELLETYVLLLSAAGLFITGQTIAVDGGFLAGNSWAEGAEGEW